MNGLVAEISAVRGEPRCGDSVSIPNTDVPLLFVSDTEGIAVFCYDFTVTKGIASVE
jgi:hypothetical protein